jgi:hypothetical protein
MRRTSVLLTIAFLAGIAIGFLARSAVQRSADAADLAAVEKLHKADVDCTLMQDPACEWGEHESLFQLSPEA